MRSIFNAKAQREKSRTQRKDQEKKSDAQSQSVFFCFAFCFAFFASLRFLSFRRVSPARSGNATISAREESRKNREFSPGGQSLSQVQKMKAVEWSEASGLVFSCPIISGSKPSGQSWRSLEKPTLHDKLARELMTRQRDTPPSRVAGQGGRRGDHR